MRSAGGRRRLFTAKGSSPRVYVVAWVAVAAGCAGSTGRGLDDSPQIRGRIVDNDGKCIEDVRVTTDPPTEPVLVFDCVFRLRQSLVLKTEIPAGTYELLPFKRGWWRGKDAKKLLVEYDGGIAEIPDIVMVPIAAPELETGLPTRTGPPPVGETPTEIRE